VDEEGGDSDDEEGEDLEEGEFDSSEEGSSISPFLFTLSRNSYQKMKQMMTMTKESSPKPIKSL
jgi:hypothetical protein